MIKVYFPGKNHRVRRRETILNPPCGVDFVPEVPIEKMGKDELVSGKIKNLISNFLLDVSFLKKGKFDLIYSPGKIVFGSFPWVIELDNVACLAYYNLSLLRVSKHLLGFYLRSGFCKRIVCISEASKKSVANFFRDKDIDAKCEVVYPFVKHFDDLAIKDYSKFKVLFNSYNFDLKGGRIVCEVFDRVCRSGWELFVISNVPDDVREKYKDNKAIHFIDPNLSKDELYDDYYRKCDVLAHLTFQDSFGMSVLEAVSAGLPVICTDVFALPEIVVDGKNGFVLECPVKYFDRYFLPNDLWWDEDITAYARDNEFDSLGAEFEKWLVILGSDPVLRKRMSKASLALANSKFGESVRKETLGVCLN